jgi:oxidase EvaA
MDARTVISGIPLVTVKMTDGELSCIEKMFTDSGLFRSIFHGEQCETLSRMYYQLNNYKMFQDVRISSIPLNQLVDWDVDEYGITSRKEASFMVRYYDIEISGREVQSWTQPLFKAINIATFGLITRKTINGTEFLVHAKPEIGSFDRLELGPCIQWEPTHIAAGDDEVEKVFRKHLEIKGSVITDVVLSEEGGRFYHEQNRNVIIEVPEDVLVDVPQGYFWTNYSTLNYLIQVNNCLNIQLRNLLSLLKI